MRQLPSPLIEPDVRISRIRGSLPDRLGSLLSRDVVGADHIAPELDLALEQRARGFRRSLCRWERVHATVGKGLLCLGISERSVQCTVQLVDDRARRAGGREVLMRPMVTKSFSASNVRFG
jgi:hypothetical protein